MSTVEVGRAAEQLAAEYLAHTGFQIIERNWRNRWCELDIIARRHDQIHFVEVKYRHNVRYGLAAEYINFDKSARLVRAALAWTQATNYTGAYQIDVIAVEGALARPKVSHLENAISG